MGVLPSDEASDWVKKEVANMSANDRQVDGNHYEGRKKQHWDLVKEYDWPYMEAQIIKYVMRWRKKNGRKDLEKAQHFLEKLIEQEFTDLGALPSKPDLRMPIVSPEVAEGMRDNILKDNALLAKLKEIGPPKEIVDIASGTLPEEEVPPGQGAKWLPTAKEERFIPYANVLGKDLGAPGDNDYMNPTTRDVDTGEPQGKGYVDQDLGEHPIG